MSHDKGQFILIAHLRDQGEREGKDGLTVTVKSLIGIGRLTGPVIHDNPEIAVGARRTRPALALGYGLNPLNH